MNNFAIESEDADFSLQDADLICNKVNLIINHITANYSNIKSIGVTGQMHGILYLDKDGNAVSPLINWCDKRADKTYKNNKSYCDTIYEIIGEKISTGYGFATWHMATPER